MSHTSEELTANEISRICAVSGRTLRSWVSSQHPRPFQRTKRGGRYFFDVELFGRWLRENEKHEEYSRLSGYLSGLKRPEVRDARADVSESIQEFESGRRRQLAEAQRLATARDLGAASPVPDPQTPGQNTPPQSRPDQWDIFAVRDNTGRMYTQAVRMFVHAPAGEKIAHQKNANAVADLLRKLELDCIEVAKQMNLVIMMSDAERLVGRICARVKHDLLNLPYACAADLAAMSEPETIASFLTERITDALRHLSDGLQLIDTEEDQ